MVIEKKQPLDGLKRFVKKIGKRNLIIAGPTSQSTARKSAHRKLTSFLSEFLKCDYDGKANI